MLLAKAGRMEFTADWEKALAEYQGKTAYNCLTADICNAIANMKQDLSHIVQEYGCKNVKDFLTEYRTAKAESNDYQSAVAKWMQQTGDETEPESDSCGKG